MNNTQNNAESEDMSPDDIVDIDINIDDIVGCDEFNDQNLNNKIPISVTQNTFDEVSKNDLKQFMMNFGKLASSIDDPSENTQKSDSYNGFEIITIVSKKNITQKLSISSDLLLNYLAEKVEDIFGGFVSNKSPATNNSRFTPSIARSSFMCGGYGDYYDDGCYTEPNTCDPNNVQCDVLFSYYNEISDYKNYVDKLDNENNRQILESQVKELLNIAEKLYVKELSVYNNLLSKHKIQFDCLLTYYTIGKKYAFERFDTKMIGILKKKQICNNPSGIALTFKMIEYDHQKKKFYHTTNSQFIYEQSGLMDLDDIICSEVNAELEATYSEIGKKYCDLVNSIHYLDYVGSRYVITDHGDQPVFATGRVIIDNEDIYHYTIPLSRNQVTTKHYLSQISEDQYCICIPFLIGYSLNHNSGWGYFHVKNLNPITFNEHVFDDLCLEETQTKGNIKNILKSLLISKKINKFSDIVSGKSSGLIFLLHGLPGTGKTCTAETISELLHYPLYRVGFSELNNVYGRIEENLKRVFELGTRWNAIMLIDEADTIMEKRRDYGNMTTNTLTSIFLKYMETYEGILFLTTNRLKSIDPAFDSRISIKLYYKLTPEINKNIWIKLLKNVNAMELVEQLTSNPDDINDLIKLNINGRQITNLIKLAFLTLNGDGTKISKQLLLNMYRLTHDFTEGRKTDSNSQDDSDDSDDSDDLDNSDDSDDSFVKSNKKYIIRSNQTENDYFEMYDSALNEY